MGPGARCQTRAWSLINSMGLGEYNYAGYDHLACGVGPG